MKTLFSNIEFEGLNAKAEKFSIMKYFEITNFTFNGNQEYYTSPGVTSETTATSNQLALKVICSSWNKILFE